MFVFKFLDFLMIRDITLYFYFRCFYIDNSKNQDIIIIKYREDEAVNYKTLALR